MALIQLVSIDEAVYIWKNEINKILFNQSINKAEILSIINTVNYKSCNTDAYLRDRMNLVGFLDKINAANLAYSNNVLYAACTDVTQENKQYNVRKMSDAWYRESTYGKATYFQLNNQTKDMIYKILLASSAIPLVYNPVPINGRYYADGGLVDNIPIYPISYISNNNIIVISCNNINNNKLIKKFPTSSFYIIKPSKNLGNLITGTLNFSKEKISYMINLGFSDGIDYLKKYNLM